MSYGFQVWFLILTRQKVFKSLKISLTKENYRTDHSQHQIISVYLLLVCICNKLYVCKIKEYLGTQRSRHIPPPESLERTLMPTIISAQ